LSDLDRKLIRGSAWLALSYGGGQIVSLVVTAVLAHFVAPQAFGVIALASIAISFVTTLQESGLGLALIHRRTEVEEAAGTVFVFNVAASFALYGVAFLTAPLLARIVSQPQVTEVVRVLSLVLILRAPSIVSGALIERELAFASRAKGELAGAAAQAAVSIPLAVAGAGVWSLVAGQLVSQGLQSVIWWWAAPLRPSPRTFSWPLLRELGRYGRHITAGNLIGFVDANIDTATVGRIVGAAGVGYYNLAWRLSNLPATGIAYIVGRVMFPAYATMQNDRPAFRDAFLTNIRRVALVALPVGIGILLCADPLVVGLFGGRWEPAVWPLRLLAIFGILRAFAGSTGAVFQAAGEPQRVFQLSLWHFIVLCAGLVTMTPEFGINGAAGAVAIAAVTTTIAAFWFALKTLQLPLRELFAAIERPSLCSLPLAVALVVLQYSTQDVRPVLELILLVVVGVLVYAASALTIARSEVRAIGAAFRST
jgi:PST family polysaccharide transporter/lipopolysaccharide exporter